MEKIVFESSRNSLVAQERAVDNIWITKQRSKSKVALGTPTPRKGAKALPNLALRLRVSRSWDLPTQPGEGVIFIFARRIIDYEGSTRL